MQGKREGCTNPITGCKISHHGSCVHHICEGNAALAAEACVGTQKFQYPRGLGALVTDFHQKPTVAPVTCPGAGKEPVEVQEINLKVAFAMLPLNTKF